MKKNYERLSWTIEESVFYSEVIQFVHHKLDRVRPLQNQKQSDDQII